jgi:alpha-beta hydrolase superfamily lysophospholipase
MGEHALRYADLAAALNAEGYVVYAQDHRGHGATAESDDLLGVIGATGWTELVEDIERLRRLAVAAHPALPVVLLGHSMGSFAAQQYLPGHSGDVAAVVLTGTAAIDLLEPALDLSGPLDLTAFNAPFAPARTDYDWLSRDDEQVDRYVADPHCGFGLDPDATRQMFAAARPLADVDVLRRVRPELPLFVAVGELDPVNGQLALVNALVDRYRAAGLTDVTLTVYPGARHEVLNETNRDEVFGDLLAWLRDRLNR